MKKIAGMILCCIITLSFVGCGATASYDAGTYSIKTPGMKGEMTVDVTFSETAITDVKVSDHKETFGIGYGLDTTPIEVIPAQIVETQSLDVDSVTGASLTSLFIKTAVGEAVNQAGGDATALKVKRERAASKDKNLNVDVVVIGGGAAGLSAALEAAANGADVLILEKQGIVGGATTRSGGKLMANGTDIQKEAGISDSNKKMFDYLKSVGGNFINDKKLSKFVNNSLDTYNWMVAQGVKVHDVEPIHSSLPTWRVHNVVGGGGMTDGHGGQIIVPMMENYKKLDGDILYDVTAGELLVDENNRVIGVKGTHKDGSAVKINAESVILATGGYASNREMMVPYSEFTKNYVTQVPSGNLGDGIKMVEAIGGQIYQNPSTQVVYVSFTSGVGINEESGLIVTDKGERIANEYTYQYHIGDALAKAKSSTAYYIAAANDPNPTVQYGMSLDSTASAATLEELAGIIGADANTLEATVDRYNQLCAAGSDADYGKPSEKMIAVEGAKYFAIKLSPAVTVTYSGIVTDMEAQVLDKNNRPIEGLYAAGETAFPGLIGTEYPGCGMAISSGAYYGRVAGANAAGK
jgi:flavocytochrome c